MFYVSLGVVLTVFVIAGLVLRHLVKVSRLRTEEETGLTPVFEETGGCRIDAINYTWPLARHSVYEDFIVIKCIGGAYILPRENLAVKSADGVFSSGISYSSPKHPGREFIVWTKNEDRILRILKMTLNNRTQTDEN